MLVREAMIHHHWAIAYHLQANGIIEGFNNILQHRLTKACLVKHDEYDEQILVVLWDYQTTCKILT